MGRGHGPMGRGAVEKPENFNAAMNKLVRYCKKYIPVTIVAVVLGALGTVCQIIGPNKLKDVTNEIAKGMPAIVQGVPVSRSIDLTTINHIAFLLIALYVGYALLSYAQSWIMATMSQKIAQSLRDDVSKKINRLPLKYFDGRSYGDVLSLITNDVDAIGQTLGQSLGMLVTSSTLFVGALIMMFVNNVTMTLTAIGVSVLGIILMMVIMMASQKYFKQQQDALGLTNGHVEEMYTGHVIVKAYSGEANSIRQFETYNNSLYESGWKSQFLSGLMMPLMTFIGNVGYVAVCVVGAALAMDGKIEFGVIVAFMMYIRLFTQPLAQFAQAFQNLQRCAAASERVFKLFDEPEMTPDATGTFQAKRAQIEAAAGHAHASDALGDRARGDVDFDHVEFGYAPGKSTIHDFTAHAAAGQKIALVGPTGAGKTTMVNLLMRFYELNGGEIRIDGVPTTQIPRSEVHKQFSMVLQDTWVFQGTVKENIVYDKQGVTDDQVKAAAKAVGLDKFIESLPQGYDTVLDDKSALSAGQKQLLTIARAMVQDAPILILDEATSSVDTRTEELIQNAMDKLAKGRTSFVIAHRLSTIRNADQILVMNHGEIIERGTHQQLLDAGGFYANLYNSQFASLVA